MSSLSKSYSELCRIHDFEERYNYLRLQSSIGLVTFGFERYVNQRFYTSAQWRHARNEVIDRDRGCDLGVVGHEIHDRVIIHHINTITIEQVSSGDESILDPENLITVTHVTHNAIHYGDSSLLVKPLVVRRPNDTKLW